MHRLLASTSFVSGFEALGDTSCDSVCVSGVPHSRPALTPLIRLGDKPQELRAPVEALPQQPVFEPAFSDDEADLPEPSTAAHAQHHDNTQTAAEAQSQDSSGAERDSDHAAADEATGATGRLGGPRHHVLGENRLAVCRDCCASRTTRVGHTDEVSLPFNRLRK